MPRYLNTMTERPVANMNLENCIRAAMDEDNDEKTCGRHEAHPVPNRELFHCGGSYRHSRLIASFFGMYLPQGFFITPLKGMGHMCLHLGAS